MKMEPSKFCPLVKKDCLQMGCSWFTQVRGKHPQTGADLDEWGCAIVWMPVLTIATAQEVRQGAAATESLRNEVVAKSDATNVALVAIAHEAATSRDQRSIAAARPQTRLIEAETD